MAAQDAQELNQRHVQTIVRSTVKVLGVVVTHGMVQDPKHTTDLEMAMPAAVRHLAHLKDVIPDHLTLIEAW